MLVQGLTISTLSLVTVSLQVLEISYPDPEPEPGELILSLDPLLSLLEP